MNIDWAVFAIAATPPLFILKKCIPTFVGMTRKFEIFMETKKILIADDEIGIVQIMAAKLRNNGFEVITSDNGNDAYKLVQQSKPDAIIIDYELPKMAGPELAQKLHQKREFMEIPVIILTSKTDKFKSDYAERLNKPFSPKELLACVENMLASPAIK